jgi:hypothetical protein
VPRCHVHQLPDARYSSRNGEALGFLSSLKAAHPWS